VISTNPLLQILKSVPDRDTDVPAAITSKTLVNILKPADPFGDFLPAIRTPGGLAEMSATPERTPFVDHASGGIGMQKRTGPIFPPGEFRPSCRTHRLGCRKGLTFCENWSLSREMKAAALGLQCAISLWRIGL